MTNTLSGRWVIAYESLETKETPSWVIPKVVAVAYGSCRLRELFITKSQFKRGFTKVVVTRACRLREWSQRELRLYLQLTIIIRLADYSTILTEPEVNCFSICTQSDLNRIRKETMNHSLIHGWINAWTCSRKQQMHNNSIFKHGKS